jgi:glycosyltransferase involved in cell wall biosynthesis
VPRVRVALIHDRIGGPAGGGGGVRQMLELGLGLKRLGHEVVAVCRDLTPGSDLADAFARAFEVRSVAAPPPPPRGPLAPERHTWAAMRATAALVPAVDAVNAHEFPALRAGRMAAGRLGVPFVWTRNDETLFERAVIPDETTIAPRDARERAIHGLVGLADLADARRAAAVVVLDRRNARMVRRAYRRGARIIRSGPARAFFDAPDRGAARARLGVAPGAFLVLAFGVLFPYRRLEDLVDAVALDGDPATRLLLVGSDHAAPAYADALEARIAERGLAGRAELRRTSVTDAELREAYAAADAFVFPNLRQTWGLAPLEALASGTPVVVSRGAGVHEVLEGRPGVTVVDPRAPAQLARALAALRADPARREAVGPTRAWVAEALSNDRYAAHMAALLAEVSGR